MLPANKTILIDKCSDNNNKNSNRVFIYFVPSLLICPGKGQREREGTYLKTIYNISGCFYCCKLRDVVSDNLPNAELRSQLNDNFNGCGAIVVVILFVVVNSECVLVCSHCE